MLLKNKIIAIIPARGGSKGLVDKNILDFKNKPLIYWTIQSALKSKYIDKVVVSSDSKKIINIAKKFGAEAPFIRPKNLSGDKSLLIDVIVHAIKKMNKKNIYKYVIYLQPTSPLRNHNHIDNCIEDFFEKKAQIMISAKKIDHPIQWSLKINKNLKITNFKNFNNVRNRQDYFEYYLPNGAIYLANINYLMKKNSFYTNNTLIFKMPQDKSIDIDTLFDFKIAEYLM